MNYKYILTTSFLILSLSFSANVFCQEICNNGIDDDADGLIDLNDVADCSCKLPPSLSLIPNPSFESTNCCPSGITEVNCVNNWKQGNAVPIDFMNTCGFNRDMSGGYPDGNGIVGTYILNDQKAYITSCLPSPLISGTNYRLNFMVDFLLIGVGAGQQFISPGSPCAYSRSAFSAPLEMAIFGTWDCAKAPWVGTASPSAFNGWVQLGSITFSADTAWQDLTIDFTAPFNVTGIAIGMPLAPAPPGIPSFLEGGSGNFGCFPYLQYDNFILNTPNNIVDVEVDLVGGRCTNGIKLVATSSLTVVGETWQWYKDGIALVSETSKELQIGANSYGEGEYTATQTIGSKCYHEDIWFQTPNQTTADFSFASGCDKSIVAFTDLSSAGEDTVTQWDWNFGDGQTSTEADPTHLYTANGTFSVKLEITSNEGCKSTITKNIIVNRASPLLLNNCSCTGFSGNTIIPNPSFEEKLCCPQSPANLYCSNFWRQASSGTSDYYNTCGVTQIFSNPPPQFPLPGRGSGYVGYYDSYMTFPVGFQSKEFIGSCLNQPLTAGVTYTFSTYLARSKGSTTHEFALFGTTNCSELPFTPNRPPDIGCPIGTGNWVTLNTQVVTLATNGAWKQIQFSFTPTQDIFAVVIGPGCNDAMNGPNYYYLDELSLDVALNQTITGAGNFCDNNVVVKTNFGRSPNHFIQWFKDDIELIGETDTFIDVSAKGYGPGDYEMLFTVRDGCAISNVYTVNPTLDSLTLNLSETGSSCGVCDGSATIQASSTYTPIPAFNYTWSNGTQTLATTATSNTITGLCPGDYWVEVTANCGQKDTAFFTIAQTGSCCTNPPVLALSTKTNESCSLGNGSATVEVTAGTGTAPFVYTWNTTPVQTGITATGLSAGTFQVIVTDGVVGCADTLDVTINNSILSVAKQQGSANCPGCNCKEWAMVNATSGTAPFSYSWSGLPSGQAGRYQNKLCPGNYDVTVTDSAGCSEVVSVNVP